MFRIKISAAKQLGSAVARSTPPFGRSFTNQSVVGVKKKTKRLIPTLLIIAAIASLGLALDFYQRNRVALPRDVITLAEFATRMPTPVKVVAFERNGSSYIEVIGRPRPSFPTVPSGSPAYIFDSNGHISYWTGDIGDSPPYWEDWQNRSNSREVSMQQALKSVSHR